jgi:hypothetical protein
MMWRRTTERTARGVASFGDCSFDPAKGQADEWANVPVDGFEPHAIWSAGVARGAAGVTECCALVSDLPLFHG